RPHAHRSQGPPHGGYPKPGVESLALVHRSTWGDPHLDWFSWLPASMALEVLTAVSSSLGEAAPASHGGPECEGRHGVSISLSGVVVSSTVRVTATARPTSGSWPGIAAVESALDGDGADV